MIELLESGFKNRVDIAGVPGTVLGHEEVLSGSEQLFLASLSTLSRAANCPV